MSEPSLVDRWWQAAGLWSPLPVFEALVAEGADVDARDRYGQTALFWMVRDGGSLPHLRWLIAHGADVNARDATGRSLVSAAAAGCASALERNGAYLVEAVLRDHGFREQPGGAPTVEDFLGTWYASRGRDRGRRVVVRRSGLSGEVVRLDFYEPPRINEAGQLRADGERAGELVHLRLTLLPDHGARFFWNDGVTHPWDFTMRRRPPVEEA